MKRLYLLAFLFLAGGAIANEPFVCLPDAVLPLKAVYVKLPSSASSTMEYVAVWACKTPTGFVNQVYAFSRKEVEGFIPAFIAGKLNEPEANAICAAKCETYRGDTSLTLAMRSISKPYLARAEVAASGASTSAPVYTLNADGTRNPKAVPNARVQVQNGCNTNARVGSTNYYRVDGNPNMATADPTDVLKNVVARCTLILPLGSNE